MTFTKEEKTVFIIIAVAVLSGTFINLFLSYDKKISDVPLSSGIAAININTATAEEFDRLPGVGAVIAQRLVDYRSQNNGFKSTAELKNVKGITAKKFAAMEKYLTVGQ
ncbi:MAG: helix-hairpin-helix domain-containing protein [Spirochaetia bacterium]|nr:helix-hairpin-helix domain-containing protein [Spirochaetia bacterium]